jgi:hypothetical protein
VSSVIYKKTPTIDIRRNGVLGRRQSASYGSRMHEPAEDAVGKRGETDDFEVRIAERN